ncbi:hypothetical protein [Campylobacter hyointestinalis]|nr:hypothetical protein [Campylobacter hyointestinalis]
MHFVSGEICSKTYSKSSKFIVPFLGWFGDGQKLHLHEQISLISI